jgi:thiamine-monophosphate kinase
VGFRLDSLPISQRATDFGGLHDLDPGDLALYGGEEYELVFTLRPGRLEAAKEALNQAGCSLIELGEAIQDKKIVYIEDGIEKPIKKGGWEHFKTG